MAVTSGKDCICSLPTGYGKSLTYELLPFMEPECLVIVIVPLNAIIDQQLKKLGDMAMRLKSDLTPIKSGHIKYIFSHPEDILNNKNFNDYFLSESFRERNINVYLVVDEAHCILEWGEDFRPEIKKIAQIRSVLKCQILALSAKVTEHGQRTISENLLMTTFSSVCASPAKENISLIVLTRPSPNAKGNCAETPYTYIFSPILEELIKEKENFPITIIYCKSLQWIGYGYQIARQKLGSYFYAGESKELQNARVVMFHSSMEKDSGKLKDAILSSLQKPVAECPIRLIFSTVALGMGADLKHVQRVIHAGPPTSLERWNDVGYHNPTMITPNIDKLAYQGVILNHSYVQPVCSPSRHAFVTGYYPFKAGLQHMVIWDEQDVCSPLNMPFLSDHLKKAGYATHAIGKWHLGFCSWECTPEYRGFDSFYGYYNSRSDYFTHVEANYLDFHDGYDVVWDKNGSYSADLYSERAERIIKDHNESQPLFMYLPYQNVHEPLEVPPQYEALYPDVKTPARRTYCGMVTALDAAIGRVVEALKKKGLYDDTIFFFTPDNGGMIAAGGNNWPLRGSKITIWEGGTRTVGFVSGSRLQKYGYTFDGLMHAVDWHPTILSAAGLTPDPNIDGISQWEAISTGTDGNRTEFIYNLDDTVPATQGHAGIRIGDYKLLEGNTGLYNGWYPPDKVYTEETLEETSSFTEMLKAGNESYTKLFNLKDDPNEYKNLADDMPDMVKKLRARMNEYKKQMIPAKIPKANPAANPKYFGNAWTPGWCKKPMA